MASIYWKTITIIIVGCILGYFTGTAVGCLECISVNIKRIADAFDKEKI